jgi:hypothetical protein
MGLRRTNTVRPYGINKFTHIRFTGGKNPAPTDKYLAQIELTKSL